MKRIYSNLKSQGTLFAEHYIDDYLPKEHEIYAFEKLFKQLDLSPLMNSYGSEGGKLYDPVDMFSILLYSYLQGISSSIQISRLLREHLCFIKLSGKCKISSRAIREFRLRNKELFTDLLSSSVELCLESGLVKLTECFGIDGSKMKAYAAKSKNASIEKWEERQDRILASVSAYLEKCAESDAQEESGELEEQEKQRIEEIHEKLKEIKERKLKLKSGHRKAASKSQEKQKTNKAESKTQGARAERPELHEISELQEAGQALSKCSQIASALEKHAQSHPEKVVNISDPDAALMKNKGSKQSSYNSQILSSLDSQVILAADVSNQENDQAQLKPMLKQLKRNVKASPSHCENAEQPKSLKVLADAGYNKGSNLENVDKDKEIDACISMKDRSKDDLSPEDARFLKENFSYDEHKDEWLCPKAKPLENYGNELRENKSYTVYAGSREACLACSLYSKCVKSKAELRRGYRTLADDGFLVYRKEMRQKMDDDEAKKIYPKSSQVEAVFGQIKANKAFSSFRLRGLGSVKAEFMLISIAHNMGKLNEIYGKGRRLGASHCLLST